MRPPSEDLSAFQRGGNAGLLNYELMGSQNQFSGTSSRYTSANTELGLIAGDWLLRSFIFWSPDDDGPALAGYGLLVWPTH